MNGRDISLMGEEEAITDAMLDSLFPASQSSYRLADEKTSGGTAATTKSSTGFYTKGVTAPRTSLPLYGLQNVSFDIDKSGLSQSMEKEGVVLLGQRRRSSAVAPNGTFLGSDDDDDDITSDDGGDFEFFTDGVDDADAYDLLRNYLVFRKQQDRELQELEAECEALEEEQKQLYGEAMAADMAKKCELFNGAPSGASSVDGALGVTSASAALSHKSRSSAAVSVASSHNSAFAGGRLLASTVAMADEFNELAAITKRPCRYMDPTISPSKHHPYHYGRPAIEGVFSSVFKNGLLYKATTADNRWVFYNDSQKYQMEVRYVFGASSAIVAGPKATLKNLRSGEMEVSMVVYPQETMVLVEGSVNGFRNVSVAVPVAMSYTNPLVAKEAISLAQYLDKLALRAKKLTAAAMTPEEVLQLCEEDPSLHFMDPTFPPCQDSIYRSKVDDVYLWDSSWRRPDDYLPTSSRSDANLFGGFLLPTDPCLGDGGDVYFCSAACMLAEYPNQVRSLFRHPVSTEMGKEERHFGAYRVTLNHGGWWTTTIVDDYLPASMKGPVFGRCQHDLRKLWYPLLEKAYAKLHGSYAAIQCGDPLEALQDMTGFPMNRFDEEWERASSSEGGTSARQYAEWLFAQLEAKVAARFVVCLSLPDEGPSGSNAMNIGMIYGMSYTVLRMVRHGAHRLVLLRCPTMVPNCGGKWAPGSDSWKAEPELATVCGMDDHGEAAMPDGVWLDWHSEALVMFEGGGVCHTAWGWHDIRVRGSFTNGVPTVALEVHVTGGPVEAYCLLSQDDDRGVQSTHPSHLLSPLMLCVCRAQRDGEQAKSASPKSERVAQQVDLVCSTDPANPTDQLNYILGRDVAMRYTFEPSPSPYYVIPRSRGTMVNKLFSLGLLADKIPAASGNFVVRAVQLPPSSSIFLNRRSFTPREVQHVDASFQFRSAESGRVYTGYGNVIAPKSR